ncbi:unnamed protein product, partial [Tuber aestivum]
MGDPHRSQANHAIIQTGDSRSTASAAMTKSCLPSITTLQSPKAYRVLGASCGQTGRMKAILTWWIMCRKPSRSLSPLSPRHMERLTDYGYSGLNGGGEEFFWCRCCSGTYGYGLILRRAGWAPEYCLMERR